MEYIKVPSSINISDLLEKNYSLSARQYKRYTIENNNSVKLKDLLDRELIKSDLGIEVGSENYINKSEFYFVKTKALQSDSYLLDINNESFQCIKPQSFINMNLKEGDLIISKDSNVGEIAILDKDYPCAMLCGAIYKLPISKHKLYILAFIKSKMFREQLDYIIPKGSTIKHGKKLFLEALITFPSNTEIIDYVEKMMNSIIEKEMEIKKKHIEIMKIISHEINCNQDKDNFIYRYPTINEIMDKKRMDAQHYSKSFKEMNYLIEHYRYGSFLLKDKDYKIKRGQNLQISNIGLSIYKDEVFNDSYKLILSQNLNRYGLINKYLYLGNKNKLAVLNEGEIVLSARGHVGRSFVVLDKIANNITNIDSLVLYGNKDKQFSIYIHLIMDYFRENGYLKKYAINGSGAESLTKYQLERIKFPMLRKNIYEKVTKLYYNPESLNVFDDVGNSNFDVLDKKFNRVAGIFDLDQIKKAMALNLDTVLKGVINDKKIETSFKFLKEVNKL